MDPFKTIIVQIDSLAMDCPASTLLKKVSEGSVFHSGLGTNLDSFSFK